VNGTETRATILQAYNTYIFFYLNDVQKIECHYKRIGESIQYRSQEVRSMEENLVKVAETKDIPASQMMAVEVNDEKVCIANVEGKYYAIGNVCTHMGGPLAEGKIEGFEVQCPWHGSKFDIRTGNVVRPPAVRAEPTYKVKVQDNNILIKNKKR
jgi:nitrite reductase/ring-hydroxylating ferredoxin subunit